MTVSKVKHFILWLSDRNKKYPSHQERVKRILKQELYNENKFQITTKKPA